MNYRKNIVLNLLILILLSACEFNIPIEIIELNKIIDRDFGNTPIAHELIPIKLMNEYSFDYYPIRFKSENSARPLEVEPAPSIKLRHEECQINSHLFHQLIMNEMINEEEYIKLLKAVKESVSKTYKISGKNIVKTEFSEVFGKGIIESLNVFAYPIMTESHLIIYLNSYSGIQNKSSIGMIGGGMYFIYEKDKEHWKLIHKIQGWIT